MITNTLRTIHQYTTNLKQVVSYMKHNTRHCSTVAKDKKSPLIDQWKRYWEDLIKDYLDVFKESYEYGKNNPKRTLAYGALFTFLTACCKTNPTMIDYRDKVIECSQTVLLIGKPIRNPKADQLLASVETCYNLDVLRRLSFGIFSVVWVDNYSSELGLYKTSCSYLKPQYINFSNRVVDIGFLGRWWVLESVMQNYDINEDEWTDSTKKEVA